MERLRPDFLIVGMERSGTLWTSATLNGHPEIACFPNLPFVISAGNVRAGEVHFFNTLASMESNTEGKFTRPLSDYLTKVGGVFADLVPMVNLMPKADFYELMVKRYSDYCDQQRGGKKIVGESTPAYVFHLDFIDSFYPGIKKICSLREPKDKITSWHFNLLRKGRKSDQNITPEFALDYTKSRIVKEYEALLDYKGVVCCITYEAMASNPSATVLALLDYLGFSTDEATIDRMVRGASFEEMTRRHSPDDFPRKPGEENQDQSLRKGVTGDWRNHISSELAKEIDAIVNPVREAVFKKYNVKR